MKRGAVRPNGKSKPTQIRVRSEGPSSIESEAQPGVRHKTTKEEDRGGKERKEGQKNTIKQECRIKGLRSLPQRSTGAEEFESDSQLDRNAKWKQRRGQTRVNYYSRSIASKVPENLCQTTEPREQDSGWTVAKGLTKEVACKLECRVDEEEAESTR